MSRAEHTYADAEVSVQLIVPDGVTAPRWLEVKTGDAVVRLQHTGVRNLRAPAKRKPRQASPLTPIPKDFAPPDGERERAQAAAPSVDIDFETQQFVDWAIGKGEHRADWVAGWRRWIRQAHKFNVERGWKPKAAGVAVGETPKQRWLRERGISEAEYEAKKGDAEWLRRIEQRGVIG
ncbi:hypothetical protein LJR186_001200 [Microbacterium foliorum]